MVSRPTSSVVAASRPRQQQQQQQQQQQRISLAANLMSLLLVIAASSLGCGVVAASPAAGIISTGGGVAAAFVPTPSVLWSTTTKKTAPVGTNVNFNASPTIHTRSKHRYSRRSSSSNSSSRSSRFAPNRILSMTGPDVTEAPVVVVADVGGSSSTALARISDGSTSAGGAPPAATATTAVQGLQTVVAAADIAAAAAAAAAAAGAGAGAAGAAAGAGGAGAGAGAVSTVPQGPTAATTATKGEEGGAAAAAATATAAAVLVKRAVEALPGTWWMTGLPKWMHIVRRRMLTKEDWLHVHAASGLLFQIGGALWLLNVMGIELLAGIPQLETATAFPLSILAAGVVNVLSSIPMVNSRSWVLNGVCPSLMQLWYAWYVSGTYPAFLAPADPWLAATGFAILVISYVESEEDIANGKKARELVRQKGDLAKPASGRVVIRKGDHVFGDAINRFGALANLVFNSPHLYATLVGAGWVERLGEAYPGGPALLFHAYFSLATSTSITLLAPTLYTRRLINAKALAAMQFIALAPLVTSMIDVAVMGSTTTGNPLELYLGFLR